MVFKLNFILLACAAIAAWFLFRWKARRKRPVTRYREWILFIFFLYLLGVSYFTLKPFHFVIPIPGLYPRQFSIDLHLFSELRGISDIKQQWYYSLANIVMTVPFGLFMPMLYPFARKIYITALLGLGFSATIELTQVLFTTTRTATVDDLFFNTVGAVIGFCCFYIGNWKGKLEQIGYKLERTKGTG